MIRVSTVFPEAGKVRKEAVSSSFEPANALVTGMAGATATPSHLSETI